MTERILIEESPRVEVGIGERAWQKEKQMMIVLRVGDRVFWKAGEWTVMGYCDDGLLMLRSDDGVEVAARAVACARAPLAN